MTSGAEQAPALMLRPVGHIKCEMPSLESLTGGSIHRAAVHSTISSQLRDREARPSKTDRTRTGSGINVISEISTGGFAERQ